MILSESEKNRIKGLYGLVTEQDNQWVTINLLIREEKGAFNYEVNDDYDELFDIIGDFLQDFLRKQGSKITGHRKDNLAETYIRIELKTLNSNISKEFTESLSEYLKRYNVTIEKAEFFKEKKLTEILLKNNNTVNESLVVEQQEITKENLPKPIKDFIAKNKMYGKFYKGDIYDSSNTNKDVYTFVYANRMAAGSKSSPITFTLQQMEEFNRNTGKLNQCRTKIKDYNNRRQELRNKGIKGKEKKQILDKEFSDIRSCWSIVRIGDVAERGKSTVQ